jgi:hypothetical protein
MEKLNLIIPTINLWTVLMILILGICEFALSWLNHRINIFTIGRHAFEATRLDLIANSIAELMPFFIYVIDPNILYVLPKILANTLGTFVVASRKLECPVCGEIVGTEIDGSGVQVFFNLSTHEVHKCKRPKPTGFPSNV